MKKDKEKEKGKKTRKRPLADKLALPVEIVSGVPRTTISGGSEVLIENHVGLKVYTRQCIEVRTRDGILRVSGDDLELTAMTRTEIVVRGFVVAVENC